MTTVTIREAQEQLPSLIDQAAGGEEVIIARDGATAMRLMPVESNLPKRRIGLLDGLYKVPDDIDTPFEAEIEEMFFGDSAGK